MEQLFTSLLLGAVSVSLDPAVGEALAGNHRAWLDLTQRREQVRRVWADWFRRYDVLLCPVMPMLAFPHDTGGTIADRYVIINGRSRPQSETLAWTGLVGMAYLPSTVVPVGRTPGGVPVGVQVVGPYLEDRTTLDVARHLFRLQGGYVPPPIAT
jgi:amidase